MFDISNCTSDNIIESELKPYINVLAEPYFYEPLLKLAKNISQKEALVYLDLVDIISTLSVRFHHVVP